MAHAVAAKHPPAIVEVRSDDGVVSVNVDLEDRLVFTLGDARTLVRVLRGIEAPVLIQRLEAAIQAAHQHFRGSRRHSSMVA